MTKTPLDVTQISIQTQPKFGHRRIVCTLCASLLASLLLSACSVIALADAAVGTAISVTGAVVSTGAKVTGKVIGAAVDVVLPDSD